MSNMQVYAARAFEALKSLFALVGVVALATWFALPINPSVSLPAGFPSFAPIESAAAEATEAPEVAEADVPEGEAVDTVADTPVDDEPADEKKDEA